MGLIGWIKKEIESSSRNSRRQSAPAPTNHNLSHQDIAYRRALEKFREYRNSGRFERLNETKNTSVLTNADTTAHNNSDNKTINDIYISDVEIQSHERDRLLQHHWSAGHNKTGVIYSNCNASEVNNKNKRMSLPIIVCGDKIDTAAGKSKRKANNNKKAKQPTSTIDEIEEFEQNHCHKLDEMTFDDNGAARTPPTTFYRNNSEPYNRSSGKKMSSVEVRKQTPKRLMGKNILRRNKGKAPQPPKQQQKDVTSDATVNFYDGNLKRYGMSPASNDSDEFVISSRAYKEKMNRRMDKIDSVGGSTYSLSLENVPTNTNVRRQSSLNYQTVINKHGEEVEYALPYNERDSSLHIPPLPVAPQPSNNQHQISTQFEQIIDQNFKFLNSKLDFLNSQIDGGEEVTIETVDFRQRQQNLQVTDLDKSNENGLAFPMQTGDILKDLDALTKWTQNVDVDDPNQSPLQQYQATNKGVKVFNACDIKYKCGSLRSSFSTPLEFSNGYFHQTPITLRSTLPNYYSINNFADIGCKREFEILCQIKHMSIVALMGISFDRDLRVTSLIMEPFDYTLNHYLHQMDKFYNIQQTVSIIHQIAKATQYLNECGFIHSNINTHAVLIRENPFAVKLSSFELTTDVLTNEAIENVYELQKVTGNVDVLSHDASNDQLTFEKYKKLSKQHFYNRISLSATRYDECLDENDNHHKLPYSIAYRRMFSMHYYQAPELLIPITNSSVNYVRPTIKCDVYGLALMLWELTNRVVPYVIYNHDELIKGLIHGNIQLPILNKSSMVFSEIFESCLNVDSKSRLSSVSKFVEMLDDLQLLGEKDNIEVLEVIEPQHYNNSNSNQKKTEKNIKNSDQRDKLREKIYFSKTEIDPQKRFENALTCENLASLGMQEMAQQASSQISEEIEPHLVSFSQQPGILQDDAVIDRIRKTVQIQSDITPKKPCRKFREDEQQVLEHSKNSTMFQSFFGFDRLETPKIDKDVIYERTSTLKKRMKAENGTQKKSVKGLFDIDVKSSKNGGMKNDFEVMSRNRPKNDFEVMNSNIGASKHDFEVTSTKTGPKHDFEVKKMDDEKKILRDQFEKMNEELNMIINDYNKSDFMQEIVQEFQQREKAKKVSSDLMMSSFLNKGMQDANLSRSFEELPIIDKENSPMKCSAGNLNRYSSQESFSLPHTPIARQNMIRRNAWLSDNNRQCSSSYISDEIARRSLKFNCNKNSPDTKPQSNVKQYNVNIKIHHNDLENQQTTPKATNLSQSQLLNSSSSVQIKLYNSTGKSSPIVKINNVDLNKTSYTEDINKKYYPQMPEMLSDAIQNKRSDKSMLMNISQFEDERNKINNEKKLMQSQRNEEEIELHDDDDAIELIDEERVIVPLLMSVRDTVKFIETTYSPKIDGVKLSAQAGIKMADEKVSGQFDVEKYQFDVLDSHCDVPSSQRNLLNKKFDAPKSQFELPIIQSDLQDSQLCIQENQFCVSESQFNGNTRFDVPNTQFDDRNTQSDVPKAQFDVSTAQSNVQNTNTEIDDICDVGTKSLSQASKFIEKLENMQANVAVDDINKAKKSDKAKKPTTGSKNSTQTPKKTMTKISVNLHQITGRSSDVSHLKRVQEQVKNNPDILKKFHAYIKGKESSLAGCKNEISASCSSLVSKDCNDKIMAAGTNGHKYFCRNCGFTMIPTEILQKIQNSGRLSITSSIADSLQSMKYDDNLKSLAAIKNCKQSSETRSTEDLYIDDDFCQGITQSLAANMELLPPPDFFDTLDFNIFSAEIFHTQEHDFDSTLTDGEKMKQLDESAAKDINNGDEQEINVSVNADDANVPICDENEEIMKQDEPKV